MEETLNTLIDKTSEFYRKCPQCEQEFMAEHMNRQFCSDQCGDDYNNAKKRLAPKAKSTGIHEKVATVNTLFNAEPTIQNQNLEILRNLLKPNEENWFELHELDNLGFNFSGFSGKGKLYNIADEYKSHFIPIGEFRIYRVGFSTVLIKNTKNI